MPYIFQNKGKKYFIPRVTEIAQTPTCEMTAYLHPIHKRARGWDEIHKDKRVRNNLAAIAGTLVHGKIENFERQQLGIAPEDVGLSIADNKLLKSLMKEKLRFDVFTNEIERCFNNFLQFWKDNGHKIKILAIEKKIRDIRFKENGEVDEINSLSGTIDLLTLYETDKGWRTLIIDWKSGSTIVPSHYLQLCGYYDLLTQSDYYKQLAKEGTLKDNPYFISSGRPMVLCVMLGGRKYAEQWYHIKIGDFQKAKKKFCNPRPLTINSSSNRVGVKGMCIVCGLITQCGEFGFAEEHFPEIHLKE